MTDNTDHVARLRQLASDGWLGAQADKVRDDLNAAADALTARDAHCGHLPNELVAKALDWVVKVWDYDPPEETEFTDDELDALRAATFEVSP